ncbi:hypothetical protein LTR86_002481 [Recurvomyces mirabilis]|nr:hypothetical protein LTR86_002481 [Recurvomyces mirabilis]
MATSIPLQLFPSTATHPPPRTTSLRKRPQPVCVQPKEGELKGLALQITTSPKTSPRIQPSANTFKHSLFCEPPTSPDFVQRTSPFLPQRRHARRSLTRPASLMGRSPDSFEITTDLQHLNEQDELRPLPVNVDFGGGSKMNRSPSKRLRQSPVLDSPAPSTSQATEQLVTDGDQLSPLPEKTRFSPASPRSSEFPTSRQGSSDLSQLNRSTNQKTSSTTHGSPPVPENRSIFPQYDSAKPLVQQNYYPTDRAYAQALPSDKISKFGSPVERPLVQRFDSAVNLVNGYEHIPYADNSDVLSLKKASDGHFPVAGRKVQIRLYQPSSQGTSLVVGLAADQPIFSLVKASPISPSQKGQDVRCWAVERLNPTTNIPQTVTQLAVDCTTTPEAKCDTHITTIFPQVAAYQAVQSAANSPEAMAIATFDPAATSPEAARLAQDAVAFAQQRYGCSLTRTTRKRDSLGAVIASYNLDHPVLGTMVISVSKSYKSTTSREPRAKIGIHHPSATPAAIAAETLVLAFLDFARDTCVLDIPALLALDSAYMVDTAISALFAVAAIENTMLQTEAITFAPPPKSPYPANDKASKKALAKAKKSSRWSKRSSRVIDSVSKELVGQPADVGKPVQGAVAVIGFGLKAAIYMLEAGVKVGVKVVNHLASK